MTTPAIHGPSVTGRVRRGRRFEMFTDLAPDATVIGFPTAGPDGLTTVTFDRDLTRDEADAVLARMESIDDADQQLRAWLAGIDAVGLTNGFDILRALWLGRTPPAPAYDTTPDGATP